MEDFLITDAEFKFAQDGATGIFNGYASVFDHQDAHGDVIRRGAFTDSLAERKAAGRSLPMHVMHGIFGGDGVPVGVWQNVAEDDNGLAVEGKISGMSTDAGRLLYERVKDGALPGLSIGYRIKPGGSRLGKGAGEPKRTITAVHLHEISLVDDPSNALSIVREVKASRADPVNAERALAAVAAALTDHRALLSGDGLEAVLAHLQDAHEALAGKRMPEGVKCAPKTIREFEAAMRELGFSSKKAKELAALSFKAAAPRDEAVEQAGTIAELGALLSGFSLTRS